MTNKDYEGDGEFRTPDGSAAEGSDATASGPAAGNADAAEAAAAEGSDASPADDADGLTIEDILGADQTAEAAGADGADEPQHDYLLDLKRVQAEYANYRRRTEEQRELEIARAKGEAAKGLLPVLDDLDRAEQHGDLVEGSPFSVIAEKIRGTVQRLGVVAYGEQGEPFDPQQHEAIFQQPTPGAEASTILEVVEVGYRLGDVELRPAKVVVAVPES